MIVNIRPYHLIDWLIVLQKVSHFTDVYYSGNLLILYLIFTILFFISKRIIQVYQFDHIFITYFLNYLNHSIYVFANVYLSIYLFICNLWLFTQQLNQIFFWWNFCKIWGMNPTDEQVFFGDLPKNFWIMI